MNKSERLLSSLGNINEKFIQEADVKMAKSNKGFRKIIGMVATFAIVVGLGLFLFLPTNHGEMDLSPYAGSSYYPLMEKLEPYRYEKTKKPYDNNFELGLMLVQTFFNGFLLGDSMAPGASPDFSPAPEMNGEADKYVESTDNQVSGVIEADIIKTTEKYLFKLNNSLLEIYTLAGEDSECIARYQTMMHEANRFFSSAEMYLTADCSTIIIVSDYYLKGSDGYFSRRVGITSIDVSDPRNPEKIGDVSIDGLYNTSRLVGDKLLLVSEYSFDISGVDYSDPSTYVPKVWRGDKESLLEMDEIFAPDGINSTRYGIVASVDVKNLEISGVNGLLNFTNSVYVSENNVYISRGYSKNSEDPDGRMVTENMSDIAVLGYTDSGLDRQVISVSGSIKDQYSMDEHDGHLRVVTSTYQYKAKADHGTRPEVIESASLYVINLADGSLVTSVDNFAPMGEEVASVRFDGDSLYVCTAVIVTFTDPVFFFDLSDYSNITYTDTGVIDGFSRSLINLGEGFLLGIGSENWQYNKVDVYEEAAGQVVSVDAFKFTGQYSFDYKDYLVNREENLFGFVVAYDDVYGYSYLLLQFDGYKINVISVTDLSKKNYAFASDYFETRGIYRDGILYVVTDMCMIVVDTTIPMDKTDPNAQIIKIAE